MAIPGLAMASIEGVATVRGRLRALILKDYKRSGGLRKLFSGFSRSMATNDLVRCREKFGRDPGLEGCCTGEVRSWEFRLWPVCQDICCPSERGTVKSPPPLGTTSPERQLSQHQSTASPRQVKRFPYNQPYTPFQLTMSESEKENGGEERVTMPFKWVTGKWTPAMASRFNNIADNLQPVCLYPHEYHSYLQCG